MVEQEVVEHLAPGRARYRGCRGPDKSPRKININSIRNLKPFHLESNTNNSYQFTSQPQQSPPNSSLWVWVGLFILFAIIIGIIVWIVYKRRKENSNIDDSDIVEFEEVADG